MPKAIPALRLAIGPHCMSPRANVALSPRTAALSVASQGKSVLRAAQAAAVAACVVLPASVAVAAWRLAGPMPLRGRGHSEVAGHWEPLLAAMVVACCGVAFGGWVWSARVATWQREELLGDVMPMDVARSVMRNWGIEQATSARNAG